MTHTRQGFYADPIYGGNRDRIGWQVIGFPGPDLADARSTPAATPRCTGSPTGEAEKVREYHDGL